MSPEITPLMPWRKKVTTITTRITILMTLWGGILCLGGVFQMAWWPSFLIPSSTLLSHSLTHTHAYTLTRFKCEWSHICRVDGVFVSFFWFIDKMRWTHNCMSSTLSSSSYTYTSASIHRHNQHPYQCIVWDTGIGHKLVVCQVTQPHTPLSTPLAKNLWEEIYSVVSKARSWRLFMQYLNAICCPSLYTHTYTHVYELIFLVLSCF